MHIEKGQNDLTYVYKPMKRLDIITDSESGSALYAIATARSLCEDGLPGLKDYLEKEMRSHLWATFNSELFTNFPFRHVAEKDWGRKDTTGKVSVHAIYN